MFQILIPFLIIIGIVLFYSAGDIVKNVNLSFPNFGLDLGFGKGERTEEKTAQKSPQKQTILKSAPPPPFELETAITKGPAEGTVISDTTTVVFEFSGSVSPKETEGTITYETKVLGVDEDWKETSDKKREIKLPGQNAYTFLVRSKLKAWVDLTPVVRTFQINVSPFFEKIRISEIRAARSETEGAELFLRPNNFRQDEKINITGWKVQGKWKSAFQILHSIEKYHPAQSYENVDPIWVKSSDVVYLLGKDSPLGQGKNFRPNTCFGYLKSFYPSLPGPSSCSNPKPTLQEVSNFLPACQEYILNRINYSACQPPDYSKELSIIADTQCGAYVQNIASGFNYNSCYLKNVGKENFTTNEWYIYVNKDFLHPLHDTIELFDEKGLLVDKKIY